MTGIGTPSSQSRIPRPIGASSVDQSVFPDIRGRSARLQPLTAASVPGLLRESNPASAFSRSVLSDGPRRDRAIADRVDLDQRVPHPGCDTGAWNELASLFLP